MNTFRSIAPNSLIIHGAETKIKFAGDYPWMYWNRGPQASNEQPLEIFCPRCWDSEGKKQVFSGEPNLAFGPSQRIKLNQNVALQWRWSRNRNLVREYWIWYGQCERCSMILWTLGSYRELKVIPLTAFLELQKFKICEPRYCR